MTEVHTLTQRRAELEQVWTRWAAASGASIGRNTLLRTEVAQSWQRVRGAVDLSRAVAPATDRDELGLRWSRSPLREPVLAMAAELRGIAEDAGFVTAVTDADGVLLWSSGARGVRLRAEQVNFAPGGVWDEFHMGTNAVSLALHNDRPTTVFSAEHLVEALHAWVCYCAPIHAPDGRMVGLLDLSSYWDRANPLAMSTVRALVCAIESRLRVDAPRTGPAIRLECLGRARLLRAGTPIPMRPRQLEILTLLALEPDGFTPDRLRDAVYGDRPVAASTLKADVSHLRRAIDGGIADRRYLLTRPICCDAAEVLAAIESGDVTTALRRYRGPLLPHSETPGIVRWREYIDVVVRTAVLSGNRPEHALLFGEHRPDDIEVHEHALRLLAPGDSRRALVTARLHTALTG
ncbi:MULTISPECIES: helix-turn-helix domain-containing protein [unclassified Nocardia]|uniref:helix-turn-helix domain-containing protein n=1 Tax=unclassified Nocardia TaxID=2637762 RepID=UPI00278C6F80|nr:MULTISPECIES: helix-turn-helix domain-containing protein [unclassified Nocardia]